jgi:Fe-S cluster assembly protein SufD
MNDAFAVDPLAVVVPRGVELAGPVLIEHHVTVAGAAVFPRLVVRAAEQAGVRVVEVLRSGVDPALVVPVTELVAEAGARVGYLAVQQLGAASWQLGSVVARAEASATVHASSAGLGGEYARLRTDCRLVGRGATGTLTALYFGDADQMLDYRTFQDHAAPDTSSTLLFTGAVDDHSASVYTGLIRVRPGARGTNALQTNRNLKLSDHAWAESVPNLEIENNDVRCKHESSVSPIDADQRFYLESRGVPPQVAERLVVAGFFHEVLDGLAVPEARAGLVAAIAAKLDAHSMREADVAGEPEGEKGKR